MAEIIISHRLGLLCILHLSVVVFARPSTESLPYPAENGQCRNKETEYYNSEIKKCCQRCPPGQSAKARCSAEKNTVCQECADGTFTAIYNYISNCHVCRTCNEDFGLLEITPCSKEHNTECVCTKGSYCENAECRHCNEHTPCDAGMEVVFPGTNTSDTRCDSCAEGFYNNESSLTAKCLPHSRCQEYEKHGTKTQDAVCLSRTTKLEVTTVAPSLLTTLPTPGTGNYVALFAFLGCFFAAVIICLVSLFIYKKIDSVRGFFNFGKADNLQMTLAENIKDNMQVGYRHLTTPTDSSSNSERTPLYINGHVKEESQHVGSTISPVSNVSSIRFPRGQEQSPGSFITNGGIVKIDGDVIIVNNNVSFPERPVAVRTHEDEEDDDDSISHSRPQEDLQTPVQEEHEDPREDTYVCVPQQECGKEYRVPVQEMFTHT
ncbi:tumor necrosis factor receptor superfamily member 1A-like [Protopterus annectens]|uniref:tumor necrosis factor receptor superfamily member 1A-like n=1 Tax=Protopterus annectens TaxID=7888 RepID=UPI001CFBAC34|nr:tumor necrosis factor receptor superfamily member 1A-like [Protopterus annectens]